ncbi:MAG: EamA family transporter [Planctomycetia bacterium]|nr:EamA family transporter [Planctomycetia bacterium]
MVTRRDGARKPFTLAKTRSPAYDFASMSPRPSAAKVAVALAAVYVIWGSTYLAIRFAIDTLPPFTMAGARFLAAGLAMYAVVRARGTPRPEPGHWPGAALIGGLMLLGGNGAVCWAERSVATGMASLLIATVPLWAVLLGAMLPGGRLPGPRVAAGILVGLAGVALLVRPWQGGAVDPAGAAALLFGAASWAAGSVLSRRVRLPESPLVATAMEMIAGGALLLVAGAAAGEWPRLDPHAVTLKSALAVAYLAVFGSIVGFTAFVWLLRHTSAVVATSYAYVNPLVAVLLGWAFAGEQPTPLTALAGALVVGAVALISTDRPPPAPTSSRPS